MPEIKSIRHTDWTSRLNPLVVSSLEYISLLAENKIPCELARLMGDIKQSEDNTNILLPVDTLTASIRAARLHRDQKIFFAQIILDTRVDTEVRHHSRRLESKEPADKLMSKMTGGETSYSSLVRYQLKLEIERGLGLLLPDQSENTKPK